MRRILLVALLLVVGVALLVYTSITSIIWDGGYELTVRVSSDPGSPRSVDCHPCARRDYADYVLEYGPESRLWSATADPFAGEPLTVHIPTSGRTSMSGRELSYFQYRWLVVFAVLPDGRRVGKLVEIPDGRVSREVNVELP